jgi:hypothetical protein
MPVWVHFRNQPVTKHEKIQYLETLRAHCLERDAMADPAPREILVSAGYEVYTFAFERVTSKPHSENLMRWHAEVERMRKQYVERNA